VTYRGMFPQSIVGWGESSNPISRVKTATDAVRSAHHILREYATVLTKRSAE